MNHIKPIQTLVIGSLAFASLVGCGGGIKTDYSKIGLVPVTGRITLDGEPLEGAVVFFESEDLTQSYATTDADGRYELKFNSEQPGVTQGTKTVRISTTASTGEEESEDPDAIAEDGEDDGADVGGGTAELVPAVYNRDSQLQVTVTEDTTEFDFDLKSDGSTTGPS